MVKKREHYYIVVHLNLAMKPEELHKLNGIRRI